MNSNWSYSPETLNLGQNWWFFVPCDLEIWWMTLTNNRAPFLYYIKLCATFQNHWYTQSGVTVRKRSIRVKIDDFLSRMTLKFDGWPWKTIEHLFYTTSNFVHHFKSIGKVKLELQSGNAQLGPSALAVPELLSNGGGKNVGHSPAESGTDFWALCTTSACGHYSKANS